MRIDSEVSTLQPELLSVREREVVELAIDGCTDEQIAQALGISTSTVNSYWVRVRGKLGQLSRTEIVGGILRHGFRDSQAEVLARVAALTRSLAERDVSLARAESELDAERGGHWHLLALHHVPVAVVVARAPARVEYSNLQAERLFECDPGELTGLEVCELTVPEGREARRHEIRDFLEAGAPGRVAMGVERPCYALRPCGTNFRATIAMEGFYASSEFMAVFTVREYLGEVDSLLRSLRKPLVLS